MNDRKGLIITNSNDVDYVLILMTSIFIPCVMGMLAGANVYVLYDFTKDQYRFIEIGILNERRMRGE